MGCGSLTTVKFSSPIIYVRQEARLHQDAHHRDPERARAGGPVPISDGAEPRQDLCMGPKDHIDMRILHSGSMAQDKGDHGL